MAILTPLVVVPNSYFPYIIQKTIIFRTLIELIFALYLVLALMNPAYRPKKSLIFWSVSAFFLVMLASTFLGQSPTRSWWGNWERMFGTFNYLHYFLWFVILISVFKKVKQWNKVLNLTLLVSFAVSLYSISQRLGLSFTLQQGLERVNGTIGNSSFLASYLLFHLFIALLFVKEKHGWLWKIYYLFVFIIDFFVLMLTATRGAQLALFISVFVFIFLVLILKIWREKTVKLLLLGCLLLLLAVSGIIIFKDQQLIKDNYWLRRLTTYSLNDNTVQTRIRSWTWGLKGFRDHLILGVGPENYQNVFNQYFEADFYQYTGNEVWFDRAHNTLVDVASMMGLFGLLTYLSIFVLSFTTLKETLKKEGISRLSFVIIFLLFSSYFVQNIFVFDSVNSLIIFYLILAYIVFINNKSQITGSETTPESGSKIIVSPLITLPIALIGFFVLFFGLNLPASRTNFIVLDAYIAGKYGEYDKAVSGFEKAEQLAENKIEPAVLYSASLNEMIAANTKIAPTAREVSDLKKSIKYMEKAIELDPQNMFLYYLQAKNYSLLTEISREAKYIEKGIEVAKKANELSPGNVRPLWVLAQFYLLSSDYQTSLNYLDQSISLNDQLPDPYFYKAVVYNAQGDTAKMYEMYDQLIDHNYVFFTIDQIAPIIGHYSEVNDANRSVYLLKELTRLDPQEPNYWDNLVDALEENARYDEALTTLKEAAAAIPSYSARAYDRYQTIFKKQNEVNQTN